ncbi:amidase family protein [Altibacter sp.]|uniref:amidase family protein n=1 Tax=Altibacter sp. TaxID=2024823 RepID=UPI000C910C88|nr:amidase family protein [Altibacter sp.]MAP53952.1 amidase [Altibacter sp.]
MNASSFTAFCLFLLCVCISCKKTPSETKQVILWQTYDETQEIDAQQAHESNRMKFKLIQSKYQDKNDVFQPLYEAVSAFSEERYAQLAPMVLEQDIPSLQQHVSKGDFTYEELTLFFLKRIYTYELDPNMSLHTIMALNPLVLEQAKARDKNKGKKKHPVFGMPILLKDNITTASMNATAGAAVLEQTTADKDAFIVSQLEAHGALILGKVNLSEWAYYFCSGCPLGYSALGGQTLNPYGRKIFETGGSSAGSGTSVAANYAVAAVGTETAGSIISPSSQNSLVGLKPTVGVLSRSGIVPISHTLDTPGPMAKNVTDAAILLDAMTGKDAKDPSSIASTSSYILQKKSKDLTGKRLGILKGLLSDSIYAASLKQLEAQGATLVPFDPPQISLDGFLSLLNLEMKQDLPVYLREYTSIADTLPSLEAIMRYNAKDSTVRMPYGQGIFDGIMNDTLDTKGLELLRSRLLTNGNRYFQEPIKEHELDAILSINNYHSAYAAVGLHPCLAVPMGYKNSGEPIALTLISSPYTEAALLELGYTVEQILNARQIPQAYKD